MKLTASTVITVLLVWWLRAGGLHFIPTAEQLSTVRWWSVPAYLLVYTVMTYFRSVRWRFLLRSIANVPNRRLVAVSCIGFAAIILLPFRIGEVVRPYMLRGAPGLGGKRVSLTSATSSVIAERVVDGLYLSIVLAIALLTVPMISPVPASVVGVPAATIDKVRGAGFVMLGVFTCAFIAIAVFYFAQSWARRVTFATIGRVSSSLAEKLTGMVEKLAGGLTVLGDKQAAWGFFVETSLYWFLNALGMWILAYGCGVVHADGSPINISEALAMMGILGITVLLPGPPGMFGVFQFGIAAGMTMYFPQHVVEGPGLVYAFLLYIAQCGFQFLSGAGFLLSNQSDMRQFEEAEGLIEPQA